MHPDDQQHWNLVTNEISRKVIEDVVEFQEKHELRINPNSPSLVPMVASISMGLDTHCGNDTATRFFVEA